MSRMVKPAAYGAPLGGAAPIDDGPHSPSKPPAAIVGPRDELARPKPGCEPCSADYSKRTGLPARCLVERALVMRDATSGRYRAIVHCHGASEVLELGETTDENAIATLVAFKRAR